MAQIILNETDGRIKEIFGEIQAPIASIIMDRDKAIKENSIARKIFSRRNSTHRVEAYTELTAVDTFAPTPESGAYPTGGFQGGNTKTLENVTWKGSFGVSMEAAEDSQALDLKRLPNSFFYDYERKFESFFARLLGEATKRSTRFQINGINFDCTAADGQALFSKTHPAKVKGESQTNWYADALSANSLAGICTKMQNVMDHNGNIMSLVPDTVVIPNLADLKQTLFAILGSGKEPGTANNDYNYLFENFRVIVWPYLNQFITADTKPFIVMDSNYNETSDGLIFQDRKELTVRDALASNDDYMWYGNARFAGGFADWHGVFLGGITGGTAL